MRSFEQLLEEALDHGSGSEPRPSTTAAVQGFSVDAPERTTPRTAVSLVRPAGARWRLLDERSQLAAVYA